MELPPDVTGDSEDSLELPPDITDAGLNEQEEAVAFSPVGRPFGVTAARLTSRNPNVL